MRENLIDQWRRERTTPDAAPSSFIEIARGVRTGLLLGLGLLTIFAFVGWLGFL
ncbi:MULTISPECIES: hypothetical protein [Methylobacteriaceae]|uniref:hypothetical protein n=1 Tax=Methylobacteriaceae TaxID=119045 RepID=UPI000D808F97|nr:hypothetical protein [Methylobacterium sp. B4]PXW63783.1 hypothetical protein BY998_105164 [Methylobacterium sp. B4]